MTRMTPMTPTPYKHSQQQFAHRLRHAVSATQTRRARVLRRMPRTGSAHRSFAARLRSSLEHR